VWVGGWLASWLAGWLWLHRHCSWLVVAGSWPHGSSVEPATPRHKIFPVQRVPTYDDFHQMVLGADLKPMVRHPAAAAVAAAAAAASIFS
jgi:hypothetical protein